MRILPFIALNLSCLIASAGLASDVLYNLDEKIFARPEASISIQPGEFKIADRTWAAPGVEQTSRELLPPVNFGLMAVPRLRIEAASQSDDSSFDRKVATGELYHVYYQCAWPKYQVAVVEASHWLENEVWPRTREVFTAPSKREAYEAWAESGYVF